jgi:TPR repeat protein
VKYYREAAEKNDAEGQMNLGRMYQDGSGVKSDLVEAYKWFYLASQNEEGIANHYLMDLAGANPLNEPLLTSEQIAEAIRRTDQFQKSIKREKSKE